MIRKKANIRERIAVRAYYAWLAASTAGDTADWLEAEAIEIALAERRASASTKAAATRRAKTRAPAEMLVAATRRPTSRPTTH